MNWNGKKRSVVRGDEKCLERSGSKGNYYDSGKKRSVHTDELRLDPNVWNVVECGGNGGKIGGDRRKAKNCYLDPSKKSSISFNRKKVSLPENSNGDRLNSEFFLLDNNKILKQISSNYNKIKNSVHIDPKKLITRDQNEPRVRDRNLTPKILIERCKKNISNSMLRAATPNDNSFIQGSRNSRRTPQKKTYLSKTPTKNQSSKGQ